MTALVWALEWRVALSRRRELMLSLMAPFSVVLVVGTDAVPAAAAAAVYTVLFAGCGVFRTALPVLRDGEEGLTLRVVRGGVSPAGYMLQRVGAGATLAFVQLLPAFLLALAFLGPSVTETLVSLGALVSTLWIASALGVIVAAVGSSRAEAAAVSGVGLLLLLHGSGVFHTPGPESLGASLEGLAPFRALHESFGAIGGGEAVRGIGAALVWAVALTGLIGVLAPRFVGLLERRS